MRSHDGPSEPAALALTVLHHECAALWHRTPAELPPLGPCVAWHRHWRNARSTRKLVDEVADRVLAYPQAAAERRAWRDSLRQRVVNVLGAQFGWPAAYGRLALGEAFHETAAAFARRAHDVAPELSLDDLGQALRNVWIANTLQILAGQPVRLGPALFAYSMLYPATDNLLDAPDRTTAAKRAFTGRFGAWLAGSDPAPRDPLEARVRTLVGLIEREFSRSRHQEVWASVMAIHQAQVGSLRQQQGCLLTGDDLLALTIAKGGASVLADFHLATRGGNEDGARFAFSYGAFLQMIDDLQDVASDLATGHETLFTRAARAGRLDALAARLTRFIDVVLDGHPITSSEANRDCVDVIRRNCRMLIVGVIARQPGLFSRRFRRRVERRWPMALRATRRLLGHTQRRLETTREQLQRAHGVSSPLELLLGLGRRHDALHAGQGTSSNHVGR